MTFVSGGVRGLLLVWWQQFELENLKAVFRGFDQRMEPAEIQRFLIPLGEVLDAALGSAVARALGG